MCLRRPFSLTLPQALAVHSFHSFKNSVEKFNVDAVLQAEALFESADLRGNVFSDTACVSSITRGIASSFTLSFGHLEFFTL